MNKILLAATLLFSQLTFATTMHPKTIAEMKETSVRIMNEEMNSGGTGSIFHSFSNATVILTNKHICHLIEQGGIVDYKNKQYQVTHYKKFQDHDLCLISIDANLGINLEVADKLAKESSKSIVSGHPSLLPHIVTVGHLSERKDIEIAIGIKPCTKDDELKDPMICAFFGGKPVIKAFDSQVTSNLIKPGNSGSAVFDKNGYLIGVVFAGDSREFSFGYIVPQIYLLYFTENEHRFEWTSVGTPVDDEGMLNRVFNFNKCKEVEYNVDDKYKSIKDFCKKVNDNMIWSK